MKPKKEHKIPMRIPMRTELHGRLKAYCVPRGLKLYVFVGDIVERHLDLVEGTEEEEMTCQS